MKDITETVSLSEKWIYVGTGDIYAFVTVLLSQSHNLRSLQLDCGMMGHVLLSTPRNTFSLSFLDFFVIEYGLCSRCSKV